MNHPLLILGSIASYIVISFGIYATTSKDWGYCEEGLAYFEKPQRLHLPSEFGSGHDMVVGPRNPDADWICRLPTARETGVDIRANTNRCNSADRRQCQGEDIPGDHDVPTDAWYRIPGSAAYPDVRCQCGCFAGEVFLATTKGHFKISEIAEIAKYQNVSLLTRNGTSKDLRGPDFTVGPEKKEVITIETDQDHITLTGNHPVLKLIDGKETMVTADTIVVGDLLVSYAKKPVQVESVSAGVLDSSANLVYNVDNNSSEESDHVVIANGLIMGDLYWQKKLSEQSSRINNIMKAL